MLLPNVKFHHLAAALVRPALVHSQATLGQLRSDLTILSDNDLYNEKSTRTSAAILLSVPSTYSTALASCKYLGENLWSPERQDFHAGLNNSLSYQVYQGAYTRHQLFWISRETSKSCLAINPRGDITTVSCQQKLPSLCAQSAPLGNSTFSEPPISTQIQITIPVGDLSLTGSRELHSFRFLGVRFARQPDRYTYSTVYHGSGNASAFRPGEKCFQAPGIGSEDCLFLNIWTPFIPSLSKESPKSKKKLRPVMVWIFGGGFVSGTGYDLAGASDGTNFASRGDAVFVSLNHRLGNLGFLALNDGVTNGNYGLQDIITALRWIKDFIVNFGGDPSRVTIFGESSGAAAVRALLASPKAEGLLHGAIMQSNPAGFSAFGPYSNYSTIEQHYLSVAVPVLNQTGCLNAVDRLTCLRDVDANVLVNLPVVANYALIDGTYLVSNGLSFTHKKYTANVPLIIGTNRDEAAITVPYPSSPNTTLAFDTLSALLSLDLSWIPSSPLFPPPNTSSNPTINVFNQTAHVLTLGGFRCLTQATAYSAALHHTFPSVHSFTFNRTYQPHSFSSPPCVPPATSQFPSGDPEHEEYFKCHSGEVAYPFGNLARMGLPDRDGRDIRFEQLVMDYWASFARTGDPNPDKAWLEARGYWMTRQRVERTGKWEKMSVKKLKQMLMQWDGGMVDFGSGGRKQCEALGLGLSYYETAR